MFGSRVFSPTYIYNQVHAFFASTVKKYISIRENEHHRTQPDNTEKDRNKLVVVLAHREDYSLSEENN